MEFPDICLRRVEFIEIRSTQPIVLLADSWKPLPSSGSFPRVSRPIAEQVDLGFKECFSDDCLVDGSCLDRKVPGHLLCEERRVYRDKKHPANRVSFRQLEAPSFIWRFPASGPANRPPIAEQADFGFKECFSDDCLVDASCLDREVSN